MGKNVVYPQQWQRKPAPRQREAAAATRMLYRVEEDLRAAGFLVAADLVAAGGVAVWQDVQHEPETG
jgi:hypothetical protein